MKKSKKQMDRLLVKESFSEMAPFYALKPLVGLAIVLCLWVGSLSGCAHRNSAGAPLDLGQAANNLGTHEVSLQSPKGPMPDRTAGLKKLPAMTADDYEAQGDALLRQGKLENAFIQYDRALRMKSGKVELHNKKAAVYMVRGVYEKAVEEFRIVLEKKADNVVANEGMGLSCFRLKRFDEARKHFQKALQKDPKLWLSHNFLGVMADYDKQYETAIREYQAAIAARPSEGFLYNNMGVSLCFTGDYEKAAAAFENAVRLGNSGAQVYNNLGLALCKLGRHAEGLEAFSKAGDEAQAYNNLGCIYFEQGNYNAARNAFEKAISSRSTYYGQAVENLKKVEGRIQTGQASEVLPVLDHAPGTEEAPPSEPGPAATAEMPH